MQKTICLIRLAGGLGNQLFQFAAALSLAGRRGFSTSDIILDTRFLASYETEHTYEIGFISNLFSGVRIAKRLPLVASLASRFRLARIFNRKIGTVELISSVEHLNSSDDNRSKHLTIILDGYFQHPDILFAENVRNRIRTVLLSEKSALISRVKRGLPTIGIHIRRGDYVTSKAASKFFRKIPLRYYDCALRRLGGLRRHHEVLIFSDDGKLSASFSSRVGGVNVRNLNLSLEDEFCLLMSCEIHIIANSTFSWWAAYLGHKPGGRVIAPANWYHDKSRSQANSLLLPHFELIDV